MVWKSLFLRDIIGKQCWSAKCSGLVLQRTLSVFCIVFTFLPGVSAAPGKGGNGLGEIQDLANPESCLGKSELLSASTKTIEAVNQALLDLQGNCELGSSYNGPIDCQVLEWTKSERKSYGLIFAGWSSLPITSLPGRKDLDNLSLQAYDGRLRSGKKVVCISTMEGQ